MTVSELIDRLSKENPDATVVTKPDWSYETMLILGIERHYAKRKQKFYGDGRISRIWYQLGLKKQGCEIPVVVIVEGI